MSVKERMKGEERRLALADAHSLTLRRSCYRRRSVGGSGTPSTA